jgi:hypothetical protein
MALLSRTSSRKKLLEELAELLPTEGCHFVNYLRSIRNLHSVCTAIELDDYEKAIHEFRYYFDHLYYNYGLNMTLKIHVILDDYKDYFDWTNKTFRYTNGEFVESSHSSLKIEEQNHGFRVCRKLESDIHQQKSWQSLVWHNSKRAGFSPASNFRIKKANPPSTAPTQYRFSKKFVESLD